MNSFKRPGPTLIPDHAWNQLEGRVFLSYSSLIFCFLIYLLGGGIFVMAVILPDEYYGILARNNGKTN